MTVPIAPRLDAFTASGAAFLDTGRPKLIKFIRNPRNGLLNSSATLVVGPPKPVVLRPS